MPSQSLTREDYATARRVLMRRDPVLGAAIKTIGPCLMADRQRDDHLTALTGAIVSQQLSTKAAATIFGRFQTLFPAGPLQAAAVLALGEASLRGVGAPVRPRSKPAPAASRMGAPPTPEGKPITSVGKSPAPSNAPGMRRLPAL